MLLIKIKQIIIIKTAGELLLNALTDWPKDFEEPEIFLSVLKSEIKDKLTFSNLADYSKGLSPSQDAWKMEAISSLLEMFDLARTGSYDENIELETIIEKLTQHYRYKNPDS